MILYLEMDKDSSFPSRTEMKISLPSSPVDWDRDGDFHLPYGYEASFSSFE